MKRAIIILGVLVTALFMISTPLYAWNMCFKDVLYDTEYQLNLEAGNVIRGQAIYPSPDFPAPLTGYYNPVVNTASFSIGYLNDNSRHYWIQAGTMTGYTWGIYGTDSSFYDGPRAATLVPCASDLPKRGGGETGAY